MINNFHYFQLLTWIHITAFVDFDLTRFLYISARFKDYEIKTKRQPIEFF